jgi:hypothetical protein
MKSWFSKASAGLALAAVCGTFSSCALHGNKYAGQTEVETEVPDSLENGKPTTGPAGGQTKAYAANSGVPATSNLIDAPDTAIPSAPLPPLPSAAPANSDRGGASVVGLTPDSGRELIDVPKPEFNDVSVHSTRPPAEMLSLGEPLKPARLGKTVPAAMPKTPGKVEPASAPAPEVALPPPAPAPEPPAAPAPAPKETEVANAPKASKNGSGEAGVPLLQSGGNLSSFYQNIHKEILDAGAAPNNANANTNSGVVTPPPSGAAADALAVPPPPPADYGAPPSIPPKP